MKQSTKKKLRDIRNAFVMVCVMVAMLSTASYAWFTLTDSPTVTNMQMTATSTSGLKVDNEENGTYYNAVQIDAPDNVAKALKPVTPGATAGTFQEPVYTAGKVTGLSPLADLTDHVAVYEYWLKSTDTANGTIDVGIICGDSAQNGTMSVNAQTELPTLNGSLVRVDPESQSSAKSAALAVRVGFVVTFPDTTTSDLIIWEPNHDGTIQDGTGATVENVTITEDITVISDLDGGITEGYKTSEGDTTSKKLFQMDKGTKAKVTMYVWLQGSDAQCVDQIQTSDIQAQVQFTIVGDTTTP